MKTKLFILLLIPFLLGVAPSRQNVFNPNTVIRSDEVNEDFDDIFGYVQEGVDVLGDYDFGSFTCLNNVCTVDAFIDANSYASFEAAITAIGSVETTLVISDSQNVANNVTVPANVELHFTRGGELDIDTAKTVTINGTINSRLFKIFSGSGAVALPSDNIHIIYPQWWGALGDGSTNDNAAIQAAIATMTEGGILFFPPGKYIVTQELNFKGLHGITIMGAGKHGTDGSIISNSGVSNNSVINLAGAHEVIVKNIQFYSGNSSAPPDVVFLLGRTSAGTFGNHTIQDVSVRGYATKALVYSIASEVNHWSNCIFTLDGGGALYSFYTNKIDDLSVDANLYSSTNIGVYMHHCEFVLSAQETNGAVVKVVLGSSSESFIFRDCMIVGGTAGTNGRWIEIAVDSAVPNLGPALFDGWHFEGSAPPKYVFYIANDIGGTRTMNNIVIINNEANNSEAAGGPVGGHFLYAEDGTQVTKGVIEHNVASTPSSYYNLLSSTIDDKYGAITVRNAARGTNFFVSTPAKLNFNSENERNFIHYFDSGQALIQSGVAYKINAATFASTLSIDVEDGPIVTTTLTGAMTVNAPTNMITGQELTFILTQDVTGGRVVTWNAVFKENWDPNTTGSKINTITFFYDGTNWIQIAEDTGDSMSTILPYTHDTYYLGKNDDDTPFAWKGVILKDAMGSTVYRVEVIDGAVAATDLTD